MIPRSTQDETKELENKGYIDSYPTFLKLITEPRVFWEQGNWKKAAWEHQICRSSFLLSIIDSSCRSIRKRQHSPPSQKNLRNVKGIETIEEKWGQVNIYPDHVTGYPRDQRREIKHLIPSF